MSRRALLLVLAALLMAGCRFERRAGGNEAGTGDALRSGLLPPVDSVVQSPARDALLAFQGYREAGAVEEARAVLHPDAQLLADGELYLAGAPESELRPLLAPASGLGAWTVSRVDTLDGGRVRLFLLEYEASGADPTTGPDGGTESILLVPAPGGWLVRLVHRSSLP